MTAPPSAAPPEQPAPPDAPRTAPRWRRAAGRGLTTVSAVLAAATLAAAWVSPDVLLVRGTAVASPSVLIGTVLLAGAGMTVGHALSRRHGPLRSVERAVLRGVLGSWALALLLAVPLVGFVLAMTAYGVAATYAAPVPFAVLLAAVVVGALVLTLGERTDDTAPAAGWSPRRLARRAVRLVAATQLALAAGALNGLVLCWGLVNATGDVVVARAPGGCTAVVRQEQVLFSGTAVLYVAPHGSSVAHQRAAYHLEESVPFRTGEYVLEPGPHDVTIAFDDGGLGVDEVVPCD